MIALGIDPGLAHLGWATVDLGADEPRLVMLGVVKTTKAKTKGTLVTDDLHRRGQELARGLAAVIDEHRPFVVCAESISYPRNAATSAMLGRAWGVLDAELQRRGIALVSASPQAIKKAATGRLSASKDEVLAALDERYGGRVHELLTAAKCTAKTKREHPVDAIGAVMACLHHDHLRLARRAAHAGGLRTL